MDGQGARFEFISRKKVIGPLGTVVTLGGQYLHLGADDYYGEYTRNFQGADLGIGAYAQVGPLLATARVSYGLMKRDNEKAYKDRYNTLAFEASYQF